MRNFDADKRKCRVISNLNEIFFINLQRKRKNKLIEFQRTNAEDGIILHF